MKKLDLDKLAQPYVGRTDDYIQAIFPRATTAELADPTALVNLVGKYAGRMVYDTTLGQPVWATDDVPASAWTTAVQPPPGDPAAPTLDNRITNNTNANASYNYSHFSNNANLRGMLIAITETGSGSFTPSNYTVTANSVSMTKIAQLTGSMASLDSPPTRFDVQFYFVGSGLSGVPGSQTLAISGNDTFNGSSCVSWGLLGTGDLEFVASATDEQTSITTHEDFIELGERNCFVAMMGRSGQNAFGNVSPLNGDWNGTWEVSEGASNSLRAYYHYNLAAYRSFPYGLINASADYSNIIGLGIAQVAA